MSDQEPRAPKATVEPGDVLSSDMIPFKSRAAALSTSSTKGFTQSHAPVEVDGGWVLRALPLADRIKAASGASAAQPTVVPAAAEPAPQVQPKPTEKVFWVRIKPASNAVSVNPRISTPGVNGEMVWLRRGGRYPLPERFLEAMRHTLHPQSRFVLGQERMDTMFVQDDDFDIQGDAAWEDYLKWAAETDRGRNDPQAAVLGAR